MMRTAHHVAHRGVLLAREVGLVVFECLKLLFNSLRSAIYQVLSDFFKFRIHFQTDKHATHHCLHLDEPDQFLLQQDSIWHSFVG